MKARVDNLQPHKGVIYNWDLKVAALATYIIVNSLFGVTLKA